MESIDSLVIEYTLLTDRSSRAVQARFLLIRIETKKNRLFVNNNKLNCINWCLRITDESNKIYNMSPKKGTLTSLRKKRIKNQKNYENRKRLKSDDLVTNSEGKSPF